MYKLSVVISTWRRPKILSEVLFALSRQSLSPSLWEVIVVDSNSGDETPRVVLKPELQKSLNIHLLNAEINAVTAKRNTGFRAAIGKYVVFLDDDCVPDVDHLELLLLRAESTAGERVAWCGGVKFDQSLLQKSNYYRYRDSCHFSKNKPAPGYLSFQNVVTMNLLLERDLLIRDGIQFDENFIGYGFEDLQFGLDLQSKGYRLIPCAADITHKELHGDVFKFRTKFFHAGRDGMPVFKQVSPGYLSFLGQTAWLEDSESSESISRKAVRFIVHCILDSPVPRLVASVLNRVDHMPRLYSRIAYRLTLAGAYREGVRARASVRQMTAQRAGEHGWYS